MVVGEAADLLQRGIGGQPGAGIGRGQQRVETTVVDQIPLIRDQDMGGIPAVPEYADRLLCTGADMFVAVPAGRAGAAADPGENKPALPGLGGARRGPDGGNAADDFMSGRQRQQCAVIGSYHLAAVPEVEVAVPDMDVAVA